MARIPEGADLIENPISKAPGFRIGNVFVMAGVPAIMQVMLDSIAPTLETGAKMISRLIEAAGAGVCLPPGDAPALAATICALSADRERCARMGSAARRFVLDGLTAPQTTRAFADLVRELTQ